MNDRQRKADPRRRQRGFFLLIATLAVLLVGVSSSAETSLGARLAELRTRVDDLTADISAQRGDLSSELRSIAARRADLELEIARLEARVASQLRNRDEYLAENSEAVDRSVELLPAFDRSLRRVRQQVEDGLPFKQPERLAAVDTLARDVSTGTLEVEQGLSRLWSFVEDELRLATVSELHQQVVQVDGEELLVEVVHLGMVELFFRTADGRVGFARSEGGAWRFEQLEGRDQVEAVRMLFERMSKQVRSGLMELPLASVQAGAVEVSQ
jgi:cell division protein FtsB